MRTVALELAQRADALALEVIDRRTAASPSSFVDDAMALANIDHPLPFSKLRAIRRIRTATLCERLAALSAKGRLVSSDDGYGLTAC